jgi:hypothetical protein
LTDWDWKVPSVLKVAQEKSKTVPDTFSARLWRTEPPTLDAFKIGGPSYEADLTRGAPEFAEHTPDLPGVTIKQADALTLRTEASGARYLFGTVERAMDLALYLEIEFEYQPTGSHVLIGLGKSGVGQLQIEVREDGWYRISRVTESGIATVTPPYPGFPDGWRYHPRSESANPHTTLALHLAGSNLRLFLGNAEVTEIDVGPIETPQVQLGIAGDVRPAEIRYHSLRIWQRR